MRVETREGGEGCRRRPRRPSGRVPSPSVGAKNGANSLPRGGGGPVVSEGREGRRHPGAVARPTDADAVRILRVLDELPRGVAPPPARGACEVARLCKENERESIGREE